MVSLIFTYLTVAIYYSVVFEAVYRKVSEWQLPMMLQNLTSN